MQRLSGSQLVSNAHQLCGLNQGLNPLNLSCSSVKKGKKPSPISPPERQAEGKSARHEHVTHGAGSVGRFEGTKALTSSIPPQLCSFSDPHQPRFMRVFLVI